MNFWQRVGAFSTMATPADASAGSQSVIRLLKVLGWLFAATAVVGLVGALAIMPMQMMALGADASVGAMMIVATIFSVLWTVGFTIGVLFWLGWTLEKWTAQDSAGHTSAFILALLATIFHGIGAIFGIIGFIALIAATAAGAEVWVGGTTWLAAPLGIAKLVVSIMLLIAVVRPDVKGEFQTAAATA